MSTTRAEVWIHIIEPDGRNKIASPVYIRELLGMDKLQKDLCEMKQRLETLEAPVRQAAILELLKKDGRKHTQRWFNYRVLPYTVNKCTDLSAMVAEGKLKRFRSGNQILYGLPYNSFKRMDELSKVTTP